MKRNVLITGVSTGIGHGITRELLGAGFHVFGSVRTETDAQTTKKHFGKNFTPVLFDVTDSASIKKAYEFLKKEIRGDGLFSLINNAGIAVGGSLVDMPMDDIRKQFEVNFFGVLQVTQIFLPLLGAGNHSPFPPGKIINISSVSGQISLPFMGPYAASKYAIEAVSDSLRRELMMYGIDVIVINPGVVDTPIWDKVDDISKYEDKEYFGMLHRFRELVFKQASHALPVVKISRIVRKSIESPRPKARYVIPEKWLTGWFLPRYLPARIFDKILFKEIGAEPKQ